MPRGRAKKSAAAEPALDEPEVKRVKVEADMTPVKVQLDSAEWRWELEEKKGKWVHYGDVVCKALCEAFSKSQTEVELEVKGGQVMRVLLDKLVQKNKKTGWEKRLRCCHKADDGDFIVWEWEDENSNWNAYGPAQQVELQSAKTDEVMLQAEGRSYKVNIKTLEQSNTDTGVTRNVRKTTSTAKADPNSAQAKVLDTPVAPAAAVTTAKSGRGKGKAASNGVKQEKDDDKPAASTKTKSGATKSGRNREKEAVRTVVVKGKAPVDPECTAKAGVAHVYAEGKDIYDVMLNQTNLQNNNNKFFIIQLLEDDGKKSYSVWFRWGRVGYSGQNNLVPCGPNLDEAKKTFCKKFSEKTKNDWYDRKNFKKVAGKYDLVEIDYAAQGDIKSEDVTDGPAKSVSLPPSKLDKRIQDLINLICDVKTMEDVVMEMKYDATKAPLGKLTPQQIKAGYSALKIIDSCIRSNDFGSRLTEACNDFYTRIPHDFGFSRPPMLRTKEEVKMKISLLEALTDIEVAMKLLKQGSADENPIDSHYNALECSLTALDHSHADFKMVEDYLSNTHAATHNQYRLKVLDVFVTKKSKHEAQFLDYGNRQLLWHGSRLTNWMGILSQGLRIAPPEAPVTGYMFGKGVYFADMSSKSANYCFASKSKNVGLLLLSEVSLGTTHDLLNADYEAHKLPAGKHSVKGLGKIAPDPKDNFTMPDGVMVPLGKGKPTGVVNPNGYTLQYNEFIVYNTHQVKMKYLVKVSFDFK